MLMGLYSFRLPQHLPLTAQLLLHLSGSKWLWYLHCHCTRAVTSTYHEKKNWWVDFEGCGKQYSMFKLSYVGLVFLVRDNSSVTSPLPGIGSAPATASVAAQGHSRAWSDLTATELSVSQWELMLSVRCQVELSEVWKEDSIVCESPGHCHTTSLAARRDRTGRLLKWSDSLLVEVTAKRNVVHFYSKAACICEMSDGL